MTTGPRYQVSGRVFRASMATLIPVDADSRSGYDSEAITRVARRRGVSRRTVIRWRRGETQPSNRVRDLERRASLREGRAQAIQVRSADGSFRAEGTIGTGGSQRAVEAINRNMARTRRAQIERARRSGNRAMMREARALPSRLSREEATDLALRRERLVDTEGSGERPQTDTREEITEEDIDWEFYDDDYDLDFIDDWEAWRSDYEARAG